MTNILIIDDDPKIRDILYKLFTHCGYKVIAASDGVKGIEFLNSDICFCAVITDINMPNKNGNDVARYIRTSLKHDLPIVIGLSGVIEMAQKELFDFLISKPFKIKELVKIVDYNYKASNPSGLKHKEKEINIESCLRL